LIFDDEPLPPFYQPNSNYWDQKYPNNVDFHAEHMQESDLSLFATKPGKVLVGPGISIIKIGGILSEFPPNPWIIDILNFSTHKPIYSSFTHI
jgi:hypothetical protein